MVKTPEEYFSDQTFDLTPAAEGTGITSAEQAFLHKYVGVEAAKTLGVSAEVLQAKPAAIPQAAARPLHEELKTAPSIQMIFFYVGKQLYTIPIDAVQEVIRYVTPTGLPLAPPQVAGVINLRGRITPLLNLDMMLCDVHNGSQKDGFIIICMRSGLQIGLIVEKIHNMHTIQQEKVIWNVESQIGANTDFLCGLIDFNDKIFGIVSIDMIVDHVIQS